MTDAPIESTVSPACDQAGDSQPVSWLSLILCILLGMVLWGLAEMLPEIEPFAREWLAWQALAKLILHDLLRAGAIILWGIAVAMFTYRPLATLDRKFWRWRCSRFLLVFATLAGLLSGCLNYFVLDHMPHIPDAVSMYFQGQNFAAGQLYAEAPPQELVPFFDYEFVIMHEGRWFSRYFPGPALVYTPFFWLGVPWLLNPLFGALTVVLFYALGKELFNDKVGRLTAVLGALSPFLLFNSAWMMAHAGCLVFGLIFTLYLIKAVREPQHYRYWLFCALGLGMMLFYRPLSMLALAVPVSIGAAFMCRWRQVTFKSALACGLPLAGFIGLFLAYNYALTGSALRMPFELWSKHEHMGFGQDVGLEYWPKFDFLHQGHSPMDGIEHTRINLDAMGVSLLGWGRGTLLLMAAGLFVRRWRSRQLLAAGVLFAFMFAYFFYYFAGEVMNIPRYWSEAMVFMFFLAIGGLTLLRKGILLGFRMFGWDACGQRSRAALWAAVMGLTIYSAATVDADLVGACISDRDCLGSSLRTYLQAHPVNNALIFVKSDWYREGQPLYMDNYGDTILFNSPNLDSSILCARDRGNEANLIALQHYPQRKAYRFIDEIGEPSRLEPFPSPKTP